MTAGKAEGPPDAPAAVMVAELVLWCEACSANVGPPSIEWRDRPARMGGPWWRLGCPDCGDTLGGFNAPAALAARPRGRS